MSFILLYAKETEFEDEGEAFGLAGVVPGEWCL